MNTSRVNQVEIIEGGKTRVATINRKFRTKGYAAVEKTESHDSPVTSAMTKEAASAILFGEASHKRAALDAHTDRQLASYGATIGVEMRSSEVLASRQIDGDRISGGIIRRRSNKQ